MKLTLENMCFTNHLKHNLSILGDLKGGGEVRLEKGREIGVAR